MYVCLQYGDDDSDMADELSARGRAMRRRQRYDPDSMTKYDAEEFRRMWEKNK